MLHIFLVHYKYKYNIKTGKSQTKKQITKINVKKLQKDLTSGLNSYILVFRKTQGFASAHLLTYQMLVNGLIATGIPFLAKIATITEKSVI